MCTAITLKTNDFYFGRTLDYEFSYGEEVTITPRNYEFIFENGQKLSSHFAIIGMAHVAEDYPLYYDAVNEKGLGMAGLNFVGNACYGEPLDDTINVAQYEFIAWILSQCDSVEQAIDYLHAMNLTGTPFGPMYPVAELHWLITDAQRSITVEYRSDGLHIMPNDIGVLTNNPPFETQMFLLNQYLHVSPKNPVNHFSEKAPLDAYSRGMGGLGLPGDYSSSSRFAKVAFVKLNSQSGDSEEDSVNQFFHVLDSVNQPRGCCEITPGKYEITIYTSCCNASKGIYYYTTYTNHQITAVDMHKENLEGTELIRYPLCQNEQIYSQN